jgi:predicted patatin/cPLA2 family phospholipase
LHVFTLLILAALLLQGCAMGLGRNPLPGEYQDEASVLGSRDLRFWGDETIPLASGLSDDSTKEEIQAVLPGLFGKELNILAISGGGKDGAFTAGLLNGWTSNGTRPEFNIVTGISTGALIAPYAYLGPSHDHMLKRLYTQYSTEDLVEPRSWLRSLRSDAVFDTEGLRSLIAEFIDEELMQAIAAEYRRGRLLFIGTTNLDAQLPVTWDIGAIATSGSPGALQLIRDVLLASASIPMLFPPVMIEVEANGQSYDEMHIDGGVTRQSFVFELSADENSFKGLEIVGTGRVFLIRNSKIDPDWQASVRSIFAIGRRSADSMIRTQGLGDLYREFIGAHKFGIDFNLAYIPQEFNAEDNQELFDQDYMQSLYETGYRLAAEGYPWSKAPPGLELP